MALPSYIAPPKVIYFPETVYPVSITSLNFSILIFLYFSSKRHYKIYWVQIYFFLCKKQEINENLLTEKALSKEK